MAAVLISSTLSLKIQARQSRSMSQRHTHLQPSMQQDDLLPPIICVPSPSLSMQQLEVEPGQDMTIQPLFDWYCNLAS